MSMKIRLECSCGEIFESININSGIGYASAHFIKRQENCAGRQENKGAAPEQALPRICGRCGADREKYPHLKC